MEWKQRFRLFHAIQNPESSPYKVDRSEVVVNRNRYGNVQPWDASRIKLKQPIAGSDYVNASPIVLKSRSPNHSSKEMKYIATQGPKTGQASHFWHMMHQEISGNTGVVIMLTQLVEDNKEKCAQYYPLDLDSPTMTLQHEEEQSPASKINVKNLFVDHETKYGTNMPEANGPHEDTKTDASLQNNNIADTVTLLSKEFDNSVGCEVRNLTLTINNESKHIIHYLFDRWPDFGKPDLDDRNALIELSRRSYREAGDSPRVVHCSAGVGRTGTWIALDFLVREVEEDRLFDSIRSGGLGTEKPNQVQANSSKVETWGRSGPPKAMTPTTEEGFEKDEQDLIFDTVNTLREQRMMMVIREVQFSFLYDVMREAVLEKYRAKPEGAVVKDGGDLELRPRRSKQPRISDEYVGSESASEAETEIMEVDGVQNNNDEDDPYSAVSPDALRKGMSQEFANEK